MSKTLSEVLIENGIVLHESGERWVAKCPFHEGDRSPSFTIYPTETYFCFGCRAWGDAVKFLVEYKGMAPDAAMDYVGQDYRTKRTKTVIKVKDKGKLWPFLYEIAEIYHQNLLKTPGALMYLQSRGLSMETIQKYMLGYTDGGLLNIQSAFEYSMAIEYGIINANGYELLNHRITIPSLPEERLCDFIIGRTVIHDRAKYLGIRAPKPIMGLHDAWSSPVLFVVEGQFDWLVLREWGIPSIVVGGTHVTNVNTAILKQRKIVIIPDNDAPGIAAALSLKEKLGLGAIILDYESMDIKDIGDAGSSLTAKNDFIKLAREQIKWEFGILSQTSVKLFPALKDILRSP